MDVTKKELIVVTIFLVSFVVISAYSFFLSNNSITGGAVGLGGDVQEVIMPLPAPDDNNSHQEQEENNDENPSVEANQTEPVDTAVVVPESGPIGITATQNINNCTTLRTSGTTYLLTQDASNASHCFHIYASNVELDCQTFTITYDTGGSSSTFAINSTGYNNITIRNCFITKGTANGGSNHAINFENSNSTRIVNNTITVGLEELANSIGIRLVNSDNATIENNTVSTGIDAGDAISLRSGSDFNLIRGNTINTSTSDGIEIITTGNQQNYIEDNVIGAASAAIRLTNANYTYIINNLLRSANDFEITDNTPESSLNFLIYNNSFVDLRWHNNGSGWFYENLTLNASTGIGLTVNLFLGNNTFALNFSAFERPSRWSRINSTANITFKGLAFTSINELRRVDNFTNISEDIFNAGYNCTSTGGVPCRIQSYSGGILQFNTTGFSSFTANSTAGAAASDTTPPSVINVTPVADSSFTVGNSIEIGANVTDDTIVSQVFANLSYPNGSTLLFELTNATDYARRFNISFTIPSVTGNYNITFIANDTTNNRNASERTNFTVSAAPSPSPASSSSGGSGSARSSSSSSTSTPKIFCSRLFELKISEIESVIDTGQTLDFTS
ncbi:MAG: right-handed parallel beta-helix repeat-containing protein, partial [Nanoarchaeota archaeon]|nr:right-handed parallel beta-helix repeat-containing protein [Nanoarchaeota archaeon]